jgi:tetratricopeptide (TPR) repeat protein
MLRTVELRPAPAQKAEVYRTVAGFYLQSPERAKGERYLLEVLKLAPDDDGTLSWLGELEAERGGARSGDAPAVPEHLEGALRYYDRLIALRPEAPVYYAHKRAVLAKYLQHLGERCRAAERALRTTPRDRAAEARVRIAEMRARADELQRDLDGVVRRLGELRRHRPVG